MPTQKALLVIDIQNDYFPGGKFPLWNSENTLKTIEELIHKAQAESWLVVKIQHIANPALGPAPFLTRAAKAQNFIPACRRWLPMLPWWSKSLPTALSRPVWKRSWPNTASKSC